MTYDPTLPPPPADPPAKDRGCFPWFVAGLVFLFAVIALSLVTAQPTADMGATPTTTAKPRTTATAKPEPTTTTVKATTTTQAPTTTTAAPTTTTTAAPISQREVALLAVQLTMCSKFPTGDPGFYIDWCGMTPADSQYLGVVGNACDMVSSTVAYTEDGMIDEIAGNMAMSVILGDTTQVQAETMVHLIGGVLALRDDLC